MEAQHLKKEDFILLNRNGWNDLIRSGKGFSNTSLPEYGPFLARNEESIDLLGEIKGKNVLDLGCGAGDSLKYLCQKGAASIYGIDISEEQIKQAKQKFENFQDNFLVSPMEELVDVPHNYFDIVISIFSIGYTSDIDKTLENVYKYLKDDGIFVISWTHPFYYSLGMINDEVILNKSYFDEDSEKITKGEDRVILVQKNLMVSTIINAARKAGFYVDVMLEEQTILKDDVNGYKSSFWRKEKAQNCPSTLILKFKKLK